MITKPSWGGKDSLRTPSPHLHRAPRRRLLLYVSDGGRRVSPESMELVLEVLDILRRKHDSQICLTISGLEKWPELGSPPGGISFRSAAPDVESVILVDGHDLLVALPGLSSNGLPEALSRGVPCVAVRASEMSVAITPGVTGAVVEDGNAPELAAAIASVLVNDDIYRSCFERAPAMAAYFSWTRIACRREG